MTTGDTNEAGVVLVIGAAGSIGSEVTGRLLQSGHRVVAAGRNIQRLHQQYDNTQALVCGVDATRFEAVADCVDQAVGWGGRLDGVINCAGSVLLKPAHLTSQPEFEEVIAVNLTTAFAVLRAAVPAMRSAGGSVVLISSAAARLGLGNHEAIAAAKAGVEGLTRSAAATYAAHGIRVNAIAPGLVESSLTENGYADACRAHPE